MSTKEQARAVTVYIADSVRGAYQLDDIISAFLGQFKPSLELNMGFNGIFHGTELPHTERAIRKEIAELYPGTYDLEMKVEENEIGLGRNAGLARRAVFAAIDEYSGNLNEIKEVIAQRYRVKNDVFKVIDEIKRSYASLSQHGINEEQFSPAKELKSIRLFYTNLYTKLQRLPGADKSQIKAYEHRKDKMKEDAKKLPKDCSAGDMSKYLMNLKQSAETDVISAVKLSLEYLFRQGLATEVNLGMLSEANQSNLAVAREFEIKLKKQIRVAKEKRQPVGEEAAVFEQVSQQLLEEAESIVNYLEMQNSCAFGGFFSEDRANGATLELRTIAESIVYGKSLHPRLAFEVNLEEIPAFPKERTLINYAEEAAKQKEIADSEKSRADGLEIKLQTSEETIKAANTLNLRYADELTESNDALSLIQEKLGSAYRENEDLKKKLSEKESTPYAEPQAAAGAAERPSVVAVRKIQKKKKGTLDTMLDFAYDALTIGGIVPSPGEIYNYVTGRYNKCAKPAQANNVVQFTGLNQNDARYTATPDGIRQMYSDLRSKGCDNSETAAIATKGTLDNFGNNIGTAKTLLLELSRFKRTSLMDVYRAVDQTNRIMRTKNIPLENIVGSIKSLERMYVSSVVKEIEPIVAKGVKQPAN